MKCKKDVQKLENSVKLILTITDFSLCTVRAQFMIRPNSQVGKMNWILHSDWLPTLAARQCWSHKKKVFFLVNNKSFNNQARWLYIDLDPLFVFIGQKEKNYLANKMPSWLQAWSITHMYNCLTKQTGKIFTRPLKNCFPAKNGPNIHVAYLVTLSQ